MRRLRASRMPELPRRNRRFVCPQAKLFRFGVCFQRQQSAVALGVLRLHPSQARFDLLCASVLAFALNVRDCAAITVLGAGSDAGNTEYDANSHNGKGLFITDVNGILNTTFMNNVGVGLQCEASVLGSGPCGTMSSVEVGSEIWIW